MGTRGDKAKIAILKALNEIGGEAGATHLVTHLAAMGVHLRPRTVRFYLIQLDKEGLTRLVSRRRGREITDLGREEIAHANVIEKVGFIDAKVDTLAYHMSFSINTREGSIIANTALVRTRDLARALAQMEQAFSNGIAMGTRMAIAHPGETIGDMMVPKESVGLATICSVTLNGILLNEGIPVTSRFGGLLEMRERAPVRFVELIQYGGTTLDPLEIYIAADMTKVRDCAQTGTGIIGASFREIPAAAIDDVRGVHNQMQKMGLGGILTIGQPNQPLFDIPVAEGRAGMVVIGGLNPIAAIHETGARLPLRSLAAVEDFARFLTYQEVCKQYLWV